MPRKPTGRPRGGQRYSWNLPLRWDDDWLVLCELLKRASGPLGTEEENLGLRPLIREVLASDPIFTNDRRTVTRIERKFLSLIGDTLALLREAELVTLDGEKTSSFRSKLTVREAIEQEARITLKNCFIWAGITAEERHIIDEAPRILENMHAREKMFK
jgi:hypothetical protein